MILGELRGLVVSLVIVVCFPVVTSLMSVDSIDLSLELRFG